MPRKREITAKLTCESCGRFCGLLTSDGAAPEIDCSQRGCPAKAAAFAHEIKHEAEDRPHRHSNNHGIQRLPGPPEDFGVNDVIYERRTA